MNTSSCVIHADVPVRKITKKSPGWRVIRRKAAELLRLLKISVNSKSLQDGGRCMDFHDVQEMIEQQRLKYYMYRVRF